MSGLRSVAVVGVSALFAGLAGMLAAFAQDARYAATLAPLNSTTTGSDAAAQASFITTISNPNARWLITI